MSARYHISLADATFYGTISAFVSLVALLGLLPYIARRLTTRGPKPMTGEEKDIFLFRLGVFFSALGWLSVGAAPNRSLLLVGSGVSALGAGTAAALRAAVSTWVDEHKAGALNGVLAIIETLGLTVGGPLIAALFNAGYKTGNEAWYGLPFLVFGAIMVPVFVFVCMVRWVKKPKGGDAESPLLRHGYEDDRSS